MATAGARFDDVRAERLLEAGRALVAELDTEVVLERLLETARELTGARYAAIGVLDEQRRQLERFLTAGVDPATHAAIGDLPRGRGVLGLLIDDPKPLVLPNVAAHPRSYGFPAGHPPMTTFLGVPLIIRGEAWGNVYLTEKADGEFDDADVQTITVLADWASIAIDSSSWSNEAARSCARTVVMLLREGDRLAAAAGAGQLDDRTLGAAVSIDGSAAGDVLRRATPERIEDVSTRFGVHDEPLGIVGAETALLVPLIYRDRALGVLCVFDRMDEELGFGDRDEQLLLAFAASAATAVATAKTVEADRLRHSLRSAEQERSRWARELHDDTLQGLAALGVLLNSGLRAGGAALEQAARTATEQLSTEIANLRALITELRPAALDELGLVAAVEGLARRAREVEGLEVALDVGIGDVERELATAVYRLVQEALTNVAKHACAGRVEVAVAGDGNEVRVRIADDGRGFDAEQPTEGFGLEGMRERVALMGGRLDVATSDRGTVVEARFPV